VNDNVAKNLERWDRTHDWRADGDEWNRQAAACGIDYASWKQSLVDHLIAPHAAPGRHALEIAPEHGRWTEYLAALFGHVTAVDLSPSCIAFCRQRFASRTNIDFAVTDGVSLPDVEADFVFSFDAFVHMDRGVIGAYLKEIARVLRSRASAVLHHSNVADFDAHDQERAQGWRAPMTAQLFASLADEAGLEVVSQRVFWDEKNRIGVPRLGDRISELRKP